MVNYAPLCHVANGASSVTEVGVTLRARRSYHRVRGGQRGSERLYRSKDFESPFKSDVYFFSTRLQLDQKWGTPEPITTRDKEFGMIRLRAFGNYAYRVADPQKFFT